MDRRFLQVDVFGVVPLTGNPVAVVVDAAGMSTEQMAAVSVWTNLSECTFLLPPTTPDADYRVRIFSLRQELPFAGHPTLGSARAWLASGGVPRTTGLVVQECGAGLVPVRVDADRLAFAAPPLVRSGPLEADVLRRLVTVLGITEGEVLDSAWVDNGPGWAGLLLRDADAVLALRPDVALDPGQGRLDVGVVGAHEHGGEAAYELRAFFSDGTGSLREDPVTGSLNASVAQWLLASGRASAPWTASQGTALGRSGRVRIEERDGQVWVGGRTDVVVTGTLVGADGLEPPTTGV